MRRDMRPYGWFRRYEEVVFRVASAGVLYRVLEWLPGERPSPRSIARRRAEPSPRPVRFLHGSRYGRRTFPGLAVS